MRSIVVFYDSPCIDGASAAWAVNESFKNDPSVNVEYVPIGYGNPQERTQKILSHLHAGAEAIFVDTSPKDDTLELLFTPGDNVPAISKLTVLDHHASEVARIQRFARNHPSAQPGQGPVCEFIVDPEKPSAARMAWEYFNKDKPMPELLEWVGKMEPPVRLKSNRDFAMAAFIDSKDIIDPKEVFPTIDKLVAMSTDDMVKEGNSILADQMNNINKGIHNSMMYAQIELMPGKREWVPVVNANVQNFGRRVNEALLEEACAGATCGVSGAWFVQGDGTVKLSLRSKGVPNVGEIAQYMGNIYGVGGGGHPTDAVVQFDHLQQFATALPLFTRDKMIAERWKVQPPVSHADAAIKDQRFPALG